MRQDDSMDAVINRRRRASNQQRMTFPPPLKEISGPTVPPGVPFQERPGPLIGTDGTAKGWLRTGVSDNEILFGRPDLARHGIFSVPSLQSPLERPLRAVRDRLRAECRRVSVGQARRCVVDQEP